MATTADFGTDLAGVDDFDPAGTIATGFLALGQSLARRLITPQGGLIDDPFYGYDLTDFVFDDLDAADLGRIAARVDAEFKKDDRVLTSRTVVGQLAGVLTVTSTITTAAGPFTLVVAVTDVTAQLLRAA